MEQIRSFADERWSTFCAFCGRLPDTRDHIPPRVFLDKPYPESLPVVGSCRNCNEGGSLDEEYVACLLEVAEHGTVEPAAFRRRKVARTLVARPFLAAKLASSLRPDGQFVLSQDDKVRLSAVIEKIGRGLWAYEMGETADRKGAVRYEPTAALSNERLGTFRTLTQPALFPEVGSRMMFRVLIIDDGPVPASWIEAQPGRFSYAVELFSDMGRVKMILGDYLAAEVDLAYT